MLNLALNYGNGPLLLNEIARREGISEKYLGQIIIPLKAAGFVSSIRGARGGYLLNNLPLKITVKDIIEVFEGDLSFAKPNPNSVSQSKVDLCLNRLVWNKLDENISQTLGSITLGDLVKAYSQNGENGIMYNI
jgi:Rrf2 family protein